MKFKYSVLAEDLSLYLNGFVGNMGYFLYFFRSILKNYLYKKAGEGMESIYTTFLCERSKCKKVTILVTEEVQDTLKRNGFISCSHCGCRNVTVIGATDDLRKCMEHASYQRRHGAIRQVRSG